MKQVIILAAGLLLAAPAALAQTTAPATGSTATASVSAGQRKAAEELMLAMQMEKNTNAALDQMLVAQMAQRPELKPVEPEMRSFLTKYMGWASLKEDMVQLYAKEFSEKELKDLTKFYSSSTGQKFIGKQSALMVAGMELSQRRMQENLPELQRSIEAKMKTTEQ
ncbi:DUF2059 domain-containing protein [Hymenobacter latericus]|uniref:DUF2059 domain-containing protein n=1 Tax=Hymenobacter sp. YIM 151858-1 TaxID=2987688 RepID=UPI002225D97F|nr:DUF2059 domain-containing protein [Hymenobacter sp. YIM 151858-1]UYZ59391.1 DUF2059 domain-containing protein [Hymenobacter sp. YIM 151858-1]